MDKDLERFLSPGSRMSPEERERLIKQAQAGLPDGGLLFPPTMPQPPTGTDSGSPRTPQGPGVTGSPRSPQGPQGPGGPRDPWPSEEQWKTGTRDFIQALETLKRMRGR